MGGRGEVSRRGAAASPNHRHASRRDNDSIGTQTRPDRPDAFLPSGPLEEAFQVTSAEPQDGGPAVRAVVRVLRQLALRQQGGDLLLGEPVAGTDGGVAG